MPKEMSNKTELPTDGEYREWLVTQRDYFQYLFEHEQKRAASSIAGAKVYIGFLVFVIGGVVLALTPPDKILLLLSATSVPRWQKLTAVGFAAASAFTLVISLAFSLTVLKVWSYDRLCDPERRLKQSLSTRDQNEVVSRSLLDFAVATNRNNRTNNSRAKCQSYALKFLLAGSLLALVAGAIIDFMV